MPLGGGVAGQRDAVAVQADLDALDLVRRQIVLAPHRDQRIECGMGVAAARIRLYANLERLIGFAEAGGRLVGMRVVAVAARGSPCLPSTDSVEPTKSLRASVAAMTPFIAAAPDLVALVPGAVDQKLQRACGLAAGHAEGGDDLVLRQAEQFARGRRRAIGSRGRGWMKAARIMRGRIERVAEPAADFIAGHDRGQHVARRMRRPFRRPQTPPVPRARSGAARSPHGCRRNRGSARARR